MLVHGVHLQQTSYLYLSEKSSMIIEDFKEEIRKFIELPGAVGYGHDENGETDFMVITKASISEKTKREMILWVCGIDRKAIDFIKDF